MSNLYYFIEGGMSPLDLREYFLASPISDWVQGDEDYWSNKNNGFIHVDTVDGKQTLFFKACPVSHVCITPGARGIIKNYHLDIVGGEE